MKGTERYIFDVVVSRNRIQGHPSCTDTDRWIRQTSAESDGDEQAGHPSALHLWDGRNLVRTNG